LLQEHPKIPYKDTNDEADIMTQDFLEYPKLVETAMRSVVRGALDIAAEHGLPGLHHFYITFRTRAPGVNIADRLLAQYPEEMTIVLEHQFWDLTVEPDQFSVTLSFGNAPENLVIPYSAITAFVDPSVKFGLQFSAGDDAAAPEGSADTAAPDAPPKGDAETAETKAAGKEDKDTPQGAADIVALDQFRKK
jgi:hypothetical protein